MIGPRDLIREILTATTGRRPISIDDRGIKIQVEFAAGVMEGTDPGYADRISRGLAREFFDNLIYLDRSLGAEQPAAPRTFVSSRPIEQVKNWDSGNAPSSATEQWSQPYTVELARLVAGENRDVLELGFGMGVSSAEIQRLGARSHTIIECHPDAITHFVKWKKNYPGNDIVLVEGTWQDRLPECGKFHGILFDAYPLDEREWNQNYVKTSNFAEQFFAVAAQHLHDDGVFTYFSNETDSFGRSQQRALFSHFETIEISRVEGFSTPERRNAWQTEELVLITARRPKRNSDNFDE
jgi:hypothetical protein